MSEEADFVMNRLGEMIAWCLDNPSPLINSYVSNTHVAIKLQDVLEACEIELAIKSSEDSKSKDTAVRYDLYVITPLFDLLNVSLPNVDGIRFINNELNKSSNLIRNNVLRIGILLPQYSKRGE